MTRRSRADSLLSEYVDAYLEQAAAMSIAQLRARQPAPHAGLGLGAAGIAFAFLRAFEAGRGAACLDQARRWSAAAWRMRGRPDAFRGDGAFAPAAPSLAYGRAGVALVEALVAASGSRRRAERTAELVALSRLGATATADFMEGVAGRLAAITLLHRGDPDLRRVGDRLAAWLIATPPPSYGPWFAYGAIGGHHAVLRWSLATGDELPARWFAGLDAIAALPPPDRPHVLDRSWCNGSAGIAIAMVAAYELARRPAYAAAARAAADHAAAEVDAAGGLCCGVTGRAYALLAVDRILPDRRWRTRARELAFAAINAPLHRHPNSLLHGHPGMVCLALDLIDARPARFPLVEG